MKKQNDKSKSKYFLFLLYHFYFFFLLFNFSAQAEPLPHDAFLRLYHSHNDEMLEVPYEINGKLNPGAFKKINHFMRSRDSGKEMEIDPELIRLLDHLQDHFGADTVEVICGYRTPAFNSELRKNGHSSAEDSYHIRGMAADIHLDEVDEADIVNYLRKLKRGGVGFYPDNLMVHLDTGSLRYWTQGRFTNRRDIGIFNSLVKSTLRTDRLHYGQNEKVKLTLKTKTGETINPLLRIEWFSRGKWKPIGTYPLLHPEKPLSLEPSSLPYGKLRIRFETTDGQWQNSNEFYIKK